MERTSFLDTNSGAGILAKQGWAGRGKMFVFSLSPTVDVIW